MKTAISKIYVVRNFCDCRFCRGSRRITTSLDEEAFNASRQEGWESIVVGARNPRLVVFNGRRLVVGLETASGNVDIACPGGYYRGLDGVGPLVFSDSHSVHGCWKIRENQWFHLYRRGEIECGLFEIVHTRGET